MSQETKQTTRKEGAMHEPGWLTWTVVKGEEAEKEEHEEDNQKEVGRRKFRGMQEKERAGRKIKEVKEDEYYLWSSAGKEEVNESWKEEAQGMESIVLKKKGI